VVIGPPNAIRTRTAPSASTCILPRWMYRPAELLVELVDPFVGHEPHHRRLHRRVAAISVTVAVIDLGVTVAMWAAHGLECVRTISALGDAFVWTTSQLLAGGSSLTATSALAHALEIVLEVFAVTLVAALAASVAAFFLQKDVSGS